MVNFNFLLDFDFLIICILARFLVFTVNFPIFLAFLENFTFVQFVFEVCSPLKFVSQKSLDIFRGQNISQLVLFQGSPPETANMMS